MSGPLDRLRTELRARVRTSRHEEPTLFSSSRSEPDAWRRFFEDAPAISIDHGVMERAERVAVVEAGFEWSDLGNWTSLAERLAADGRGNRTRGETMTLDSEGCVLVSEPGGLLAVLGVRDLIVVRVGDATLVCPRDRAQEVRRLVHEGRLDERLQRFF
jgi:mannose-1-phosphate guanylyltransferase